MIPRLLSVSAMAALWLCALRVCGAAGGPAVLPATPAELFAELARGVRPQWRPFFRETVPHAADDRFKAALSLGAAAADCYLAAEARDAQQIRNLLSDMAAIEMMLSIRQQMSSPRQKLTELAAAGDWKGVRSEITLLMAAHARVLAEQKDEALAELESIGCWVRAFQVSARFCAKQARPPERPCVWSGGMLTSLKSRAAALSASRPVPTLVSLTRSLETLEAVWQDPATEGDAASRLEASRRLLEAMVAEFITGPSPHSVSPKPPLP